MPPARARTYAPGYAREVSILILYDSERSAYFFEDTGPGCLTAAGEIWQGTGVEDYRPVRVSSAPVTVEVRPVPQHEAGAWAWWRGEDKALMFLCGIGDEATKQDLQALVDLYPDSAYAKYALMALAAAKHAEREILPSHVKTDTDKEARRGLAAEEVKLLQMAAESYPKAHIMPVVLDRLLAAAAFVPDYPHTKKYAKMLLEMPNSPAQYRANAARTLERLRPQR